MLTTQFIFSFQTEHQNLFEITSKLLNLTYCRWSLLFFNLNNNNNGNYHNGIECRTKLRNINRQLQKLKQQYMNKKNLCAIEPFNNASGFVKFCEYVASFCFEQMNILTTVEYFYANNYNPDSARKVILLIKENEKLRTSIDRLRHLHLELTMAVNKDLTEKYGKGNIFSRKI
eukprot:Pgem_evm2s12264